MYSRKKERIERIHSEDENIFSESDQLSNSCAQSGRNDGNWKRQKDRKVIAWKQIATTSTKCVREFG